MPTDTDDWQTQAVPVGAVLWQTYNVPAGKVYAIVGGDFPFATRALYFCPGEALGSDVVTIEAQNGSQLFYAGPLNHEVAPNTIPPPTIVYVLDDGSDDCGTGVDNSLGASAHTVYVYADPGPAVVAIAGTVQVAAHVPGLITAVPLAPHAATIATYYVNPGYAGVRAHLHVSACPAGSSVSLGLYAAYSTFAALLVAGTALAVAGDTELVVHPGVTVTANVSVATILPATLLLLASVVSTGGAPTFLVEYQPTV